tara:strand:+ start:396 stop:611 length:216 start_codon:yes stop_codon:yes gene_type:complete
MRKERVFESDGMLWNDGDIPKCSYCDRDYDQVETLHETPFSGGVCCEQSTCRYSLIDEVLSEQVEEHPTIP